MGIHWQELLVILVIVLVLFGPRRLPEVGKSLGHGIREFKDSLSGTTTATVEEPREPAATRTSGAEREAVAVPVEVVDEDGPERGGSRG